MTPNRRFFCSIQFNLEVSQARSNADDNQITESFLYMRVELERSIAECKKFYLMCRPMRCATMTVSGAKLAQKPHIC